MKRKKSGNYYCCAFRLTPEQDEKIKKLARKLKVSESQIIRNMITDYD